MKAETLFELLQSQDYITAENAEQARTHEKEHAGNGLAYLRQEGIIDSGTLGLALAEHYGTSFTDIEARVPAYADLIRIPEATARTYTVAFVSELGDTVRVASSDPEQSGLLQALTPLFPGKQIHVTFAFSEPIVRLFSKYQKELNTRFAEIVKNDRRVAPELFDEIIKDALTLRASDIHFEAGAETALIRFRIDGLLRVAGTISREHYDNVLNRMKIQSNLRTDEHLTPQDGAIRFVSKEANAVDLRLSIVPTLDGEKAVIRVLAEYVEGLSFEALGFNEHHIALLEKTVQKPFGMILTVGPTGSGKTTTLYALIRRLNTPDVNITTIEDPVEYRMAGANQIQVNKKSELTFAKGLRAVVRQDPNIILVGEIRDPETAETAVNAALTGHLLLSTFHANNAATTIPRLLDMGIEPFLLASTIELIVAQRLARRICEPCRASYETPRTELEKTYPSLVGMFTGKNVTLYESRGCDSCNGTGYKGRISLVEMIAMTPGIKAMIGTHASAVDIQRVAREEGMRTLFEDGIDKALQGITTIGEVLRVAAPSV